MTVTMNHINDLIKEASVEGSTLQAAIDKIVNDVNALTQDIASQGTLDPNAYIAGVRTIVQDGLNTITAKLNEHASGATGEQAKGVDVAARTRDILMSLQAVSGAVAAAQINPPPTPADAVQTPPITAEIPEGIPTAASTPQAAPAPTVDTSAQPVNVTDAPQAAPLNAGPTGTQAAPDSGTVAGTVVEPQPTPQDGGLPPPL